MLCEEINIYLVEMGRINYGRPKLGLGEIY